MLTLARIALVPVFAFALLVDSGQSVSWRLIAAAAVATAAITDRFDGQLARNRGLVTDFGKIVDPIADKALIGAAHIEIGRAHVWTPVTWPFRMPTSARKT